VPGRFWQRLLMGVFGAATAIAAAWAAWLLFFGPRFDAAGITINPRARVHPERPYELVVWEETILIPWAPKTHGEVVAEAIAAFQERWPNARVSYSLLEPGEARRQLAAAVAAGRPPDVYGTTRGIVLHPSHQIPAEPYLPAARRGEPPVFNPAAVAGMARDGIVWGWPRAFWWEVWLADAALLERGGVSVDRLLTQGWTWDEVLDFAKRASALVERPLALDTLSMATLAHLILNAGAPGDPSPQNPLGWSEESLMRVGRFLAALRQQGAFPPDPADAARSRVERLLTGRTAVIGPVGPHLAHAVLQRKPGSYLLVPVPHHPSSAEAAPMEPGGYFVFRQDPYQGDDHTRLAMELAGWLAARTESWLAETLGLLPARADTWHAWQGAAPLDDRSRAFLADYLQQAPIRDGQVAEEIDALAARVAPHWHAFWAQNPSPEQFAAGLWRTLQPAPPGAPAAQRQ